MNAKATLAATTLALTLTHASSALAQYVVQIPVDSVLDGRSVSTLTGGAVVPWGADQGVYNNGAGGAYATAAVKAKLAMAAIGRGLPDDGLFPAVPPLPAFQLHFSNEAPATSMQTHQVHQMAGAPPLNGPQTFQFAVPPATYSALYLILTASEGTANLTITLSYGGGAPSTTTTIMLPDSGIGVQMGGSAHFYLITDTGKWNTADMDVEPAGHTIEGVEIAPTATAMLTGVQIAKTNAAHLVFWGATGIATTPVDAGTEQPPDSGLAGGGSDDGGAGAEVSSGGLAGSSSGATGSSGSSGASAASSGTSSGTSSGASGGSGGTGASGAASQSGSSSASGSNETTTPASGSSGGGCSVAPASGTNAGWISLAVVGLALRARRRTPRFTSRESASSRRFR